MVGLTAVTPTIYMCYDIARAIKQENRSILIVIGGIHPTCLPQETLSECTNLDFLIRGEGEFIFVELLEALNNKNDLNKIKGLAYRENGKVIVNDASNRIADLDELPFPARHLLPNRLYRTLDSSRSNCIIAMRGCAAGCNYCAVEELMGRKVRRRSPSHVIQEMELCLSKYGVRFIGFLDDTFTFDKVWVHDICDKIIAAKLHRQIRWECLTRADKVDFELLKHMKQSGCTRVEFGMESGSPQILDSLKRGIAVKQIREAFAMAKKARLSTLGFVMLNAPGETKKTIAETQELILDVDPDFLQISFATPYPNTELFKICQRDNLIITKDWSKYVFLNHQIIKNYNLSEKELKNYMRSIQRSFYLRPKFLFRMLKYFFSNTRGAKTLFCAGINALKRLFIVGRKERLLGNSCSDSNRLDGRFETPAIHPYE